MTRSASPIAISTPTSTAFNGMPPATSIKTKCSSPASSAAGSGMMRAARACRDRSRARHPSGLFQEAVTTNHQPKE